jgi:hypothetical protein
VNANDELAAYRAAMGNDKADRQAELAQKLRPCCGTPKDQPHVPACRNGRWKR